MERSSFGKQDGQEYDYEGHYKKKNPTEISYFRGKSTELSVGFPLNISCG